MKTEIKDGQKYEVTEEVRNGRVCMVLTPVDDLEALEWDLTASPPCFINSQGWVDASGRPKDIESLKDFGNAFPSIEIAKSCRDCRRTFNLVQSYGKQVSQDYEFRSGGANYYPVWRYDSEDWVIALTTNTDSNYGSYVETRKECQQWIDLLNKNGIKGAVS